MIRAILVVTCALAAGNLAVARTFEMHEGAYETSLAATIMPGSLAGTVIFKPCDDCDSVSLRVSASTRYFMRTSQLPLRDFLEAVEAVRDGSGDGGTAAVGVFYDVATERVTKITVFPRAG